MILLYDYPPAMFELLVISSITFATDAKVTLKAAILGVREILGDNEKMQGKWNKDDKVCYTLQVLHIFLLVC